MMTRSSAPTEKPQAFLNIENVTGTGQHGSYEVYVGVPGAPATQAPLLAGQLSTFGVHVASQPDGPHGGSGITTAGGVLVPINTRFKGTEAAYVLARSGARALFTVRGFLDTDYPALLASRLRPVDALRYE